MVRHDHRISSVGGSPLRRERKPSAPGHRGPLDLQAEVGNRSVAALLVEGDMRTATALANRSLIGNRALQRHLAPSAQRLASSPEVAATAIVTSFGLNVRQGPSSTTAKVGELLRGDSVEVRGRSGPWLQVGFDGGEAWISSRFVNVAQAPMSAPAERSTVKKPEGAEPAQGGVPAAAGDAASSFWELLPSWWGPAADAGGRSTGDGGSERAAEAAGEVPAPTAELDDLLAKPVLTSDEIEKARALIDDVGDEQQRGDLYEALQAKSAYLSQRDNQATTASGSKIETATGNMCNLTSLAMSLSYLGVDNPRPGMQFEDALEKIRQEKGFGARTTADGWGKLANELGVSYEFIGFSVTEGKDWWMANVLPAIRQGRAVMLSISGHICRLQGMRAAGLVADDPYGASKLMAGGEHKWSFTKKNKYAESGQLAGNDVLWPWADVAKHTMKWIAAFSR